MAISSSSAAASVSAASGVAAEEVLVGAAAAACSLAGDEGADADAEIEALADDEAGALEGEGVEAGGEDGAAAPFPFGGAPGGHDGVLAPLAAVPIATATPLVAAGGAVAIWAAAVNLGDAGAESVAGLIAARKSALAEQRRLAMQIRNSERKRQRLMTRAQGLSDDDLLDILRMRATAKAKAASKAGAKAAAKAVAKAGAKAAAKATAKAAAMQTTTSPAGSGAA